MNRNNMSDKRNRNEYTAELTPKELEQRKKRRKFIRQQRRMRGWTIFFVIILGFYVVLGSVGAYMIKDMTRDMPKLNVDDFIGDESSNIYDGNGNLLIEVGTYYRENVDYSQMPELMPSYPLRPPASSPITDSTCPVLPRPPSTM